MFALTLFRFNFSSPRALTFRNYGLHFHPMAIKILRIQFISP